MGKILLSIFALGFSMLSFGQVAEGTTKKTKRITVVTGGEQTSAEKSTVNKMEKKQTPEQELESCEVQLKALNDKEAWIRSNPAELKLAQENGWFTTANETRAVLNARIVELKKQLKK